MLLCLLGVQLLLLWVSWTMSLVVTSWVVPSVVSRVGPELLLDLAVLCES